MFRPDFAHAELNLIPLQWEEGKLWPRWNGEDLKDEIINATAPWIRRMADLMLDSENAYDFFRKKDLEPTSDAPYLMRLFASRPGVVPLVDGLLTMVSLENGAHLDDENGKLRIDSRMAVVLEDFLPVLRQVEFAFYLPLTFGSRSEGGEGVLERIIEDFFGAEDDYEGTTQVMQMLAYYLGIKNADVDLEREKQHLGRDIYYQSVEALSAQKREQPGSEIRRSDWQRRRNESIRRLGG